MSANLWDNQRFWQASTLIAGLACAWLAAPFVRDGKKARPAAVSIAGAHAAPAGAAEPPQLVLARAEKRADRVLERLRVTRVGGEQCELLGKLEPAAAPETSYAIADVLDHAQLRSVRRCAAEALAKQPTSEAESWLIDVSDDDDDQVRDSALAGLAARSDGLALATVVDVAHSERLPLRVSGVRALLQSKHAEAIDAAAALLALLDDPSTFESLVTALGASGDARALPLLTRVLGDEGSSARLAAIAAIGELGAPEGVGLLTPLLDVGSDQELQAAARALAKLEGAAVLARLEPLTRAPGSARRDAALSALAQLELPGVTSILARALDAGSSSNDAQLLSRLARSQDPNDEEKLIAFAEQGTPFRQQAALRALAQLGTPRALDAVKRLSGALLEANDGRQLKLLARLPGARDELLQHNIARLEQPSDTGAPQPALLMLAQNPSPLAQSAIKRYLLRAEPAPQLLEVVLRRALPQTAQELAEHFASSSDAALKRAALSTLAERARPSSLELLQRASVDSDVDTRHVGLRGLLGLGGGDAQGALARLAQDSEPSERTFAVELLSSRGDAESVALLARLATDSELDVAIEALSALRARSPEQTAALVRERFGRSAEQERQSLLNVASGLSASLALPIYDLAIARNEADASSAIDLLAGLGGPEAAQRLLRVAREDSRPLELRQAAANALYPLGGPLVRDNRALLDRLRDKDLDAAPSCRTSAE